MPHTTDKPANADAVPYYRLIDEFDELLELEDDDDPLAAASLDIARLIRQDRAA